VVALVELERSRVTEEAVKGVLPEAGDTVTTEDVASVGDGHPVPK